jgi:hypothetical protein
VSFPQEGYTKLKSMTQGQKSRDSRMACLAHLSFQNVQWETEMEDKDQTLSQTSEISVKYQDFTYDLFIQWAVARA